MASFTHEIAASGRGRAVRPSFSSHKTSDRLRECEQRSSTPSKIRPQRRSVFREEGLDDLNCSVYPSHYTTSPPTSPTTTEGPPNKNTTFDEILGNNDEKENAEARKRGNAAWYSKLVKPQRPMIRQAATAPPGSFSSVTRVALLAFLIAVVVPGFRYSTGGEKVNIIGADAGVIREGILVDNGSLLEGRGDSPTDVCTRWAHQGML